MSSAVSRQPFADVDWATRKERYPVQEHISIPDPTRKSLPRIQHQFKPESESKSSDRQQRQKEVRLVIERSWRSYKKHGFPQDELKSISGTAQDTHGNWSLTLVESLDTLWIAGLKDEFEEAVELVSAIDFNVTTSQEGINVYDVTSKILGSLISTYELTRDQRLKDKALELATILYAAFDTPNRMPNLHWDMNATKRGVKQTAPSDATIGELGGLAVEFTRLAIITKDSKWYDAVARITNTLAEVQDSTVHPGLFPNEINPQEKLLHSPGDIDLGAQSQAFYDSLPKMYALLNGSDQYKVLAKTTSDAIIENLLFRPMIPPGYSTIDTLLPGTLINNTLHPQVHHTACAIAGTLAYTARLLRNETYLITAIRLLNGCLWASQTTPLGIMPETFTVVPCPTPSKPCPWDESLYTSALLTQHNEAPTTDPKILTWKHRLPQGLTSIPSRHYTLHPSLIASLFTLYRITGDQELQEHAWTLWRAVYGRSKTKFAHAVIEDVTQPGAPKEDVMPSAWMGASLKFWFLMFSEECVGSLDEWVVSGGGHLMGLGRGDLD
ncbi:glycoside hydrolase family 47 protein [Zasmidium cellare ATCC 36951]|uniref:alpha-1,2-Mannosidase n=1 Tax=Zasmidium cellare ATCC 36951 TaxID=1080233 RepID=A0A6A6CK48_ZASCE|nr:glycoside hydrolase family 47 protein [Zasmidium cellare ATCC 36951]KAF2166530.1 glycoside hydrolase family 47 protein [Zasmidium cellare ATCC 36951]